MSSVRKIKEFFGLGPQGYYAEDAYYAEDTAYAPTAADYDDRRPMGTYHQYEPPRSYQPTVVRLSLHSYREASSIGEPFRDGDVVVFDLSEVNQSDATRIVDFSAGVCFASRGGMKKLAPRVFALIPENAHISAIELEQAARMR